GRVAYRRPRARRPQFRGPFVGVAAHRDRAVRGRRRPLCHRLGAHARGAGDPRRQLGRPRRVRQPRHRQRGVAFAVRVGAIPRPVLQFGLVALVVGRARHRLVRTAVLALCPLRLLPLPVLALFLLPPLAPPPPRHLLPHLPPL